MNLIQSAIQALKNGQLQDAERLARQALSVDPVNHHAIGVLGVIAGQIGKHEVAADLFGKAAALEPKSLSHQSNLLRALVSLEKFGDAVDAASKAMVHNPNSPELMGLKGIALSQFARQDPESGSEPKDEVQKQRREALEQQSIELLEKSAQLQPSAWILFNLGEVHRRFGNKEEARGCFARAVQLNPKHGEALNNLAGMLLDVGQFAEAMETIEQLLKVQPRSAQAYVNLGHACRVGGAIEAATSSYKNALVLDSKCKQALSELASLSVNTGDFQRAESYLKKMDELADDDGQILTAVIRARILERKGDVEQAFEAIKPYREQHPDHVGVASCYATIQEQRGELEEAAATLEEILNGHETIASEGIGIQFSLGKIYDSLKDPERAFSNYEIGNENRKKAFVVPYTNEQSDANFDELVTRYSKENFDIMPASGCDSNTPIFIVGMPRSGTSLTEQILSSHPDVFGGGELCYLRDAVNEAQRTKPDEEISGFRFSREQLTETVSDCLISSDDPQRTKSQLDQISQAYLSELRRLDPEADRITDKMPYNFLSLPIIAKAFPNAKIIHCRRNPIDTCLSCYFQNFFRGNLYAFGLDSLAHYYRRYFELVDFYRSELEIEFLDWDYEAVVSHPEERVRLLLEYCELPWNDACLEFHKSKRVIDTASYQQVRKPIYTKSVARWEKYRDHIGVLVDQLMELDLRSAELKV